jgi:hypothetical protein
MARRVKTEDSDSCELMLDTICNVFGGMILMAVLVVIQTQAIVARLPQAEREAAEARLDIRKVEFEIGRHETSIAALKQQRSNLKEKYSATVSPHTDKLLTRRQAFSKAIGDAKRRIAGATKEHQADEDNLKEVRAQQGRAEETLEERRDHVARVRREQVRLDQISRKKIRLPLTHQSRLPRQQILLVHGRHVYLCPDHCSIQRLTDSANKVTPDASEGLAVGQEGRVEGLTTALSVISPRTHFLTLFVSDQNASFESFQAVRALVVAKGFECGYFTYYASVGLILSPGNPGVE